MILSPFLVVIVTACILIFAFGCSSSCPRFAAVEDCAVLDCLDCASPVGSSCCRLLAGGNGSGGLAIVVGEVANGDVAIVTSIGG